MPEETVHKTTKTRCVNIIRVCQYFSHLLSL